MLNAHNSSPQNDDVLRLTIMKNPFKEKYRKHFREGWARAGQHIKTHHSNADMLSPCDNKVLDLVHQAIHIREIVGDFGGRQLTEPQCVAIGNSTELQIMSNMLPSLSSSSTSTQSKRNVIPQLQERSNQNSFQFPWKLHDMLDTAAEEGFDDVVSWDEGGRAFKVHKTQTFVDSIMGRWFKQSKYKSFQVRKNGYEYRLWISSHFLFNLSLKATTKFVWFLKVESRPPERWLFTSKVCQGSKGDVSTCDTWFRG